MIEVIKHGSSVDVRITSEDGFGPHYLTMSQDEAPAVVAALIDAGFPPEWGQQ